MLHSYFFLFSFLPIYLTLVVFNNHFDLIFDILNYHDCHGSRQIPDISFSSFHFS